MKIDKRYVAGLLTAYALYWLIGGYTGRAFLIIAVLMLIISAFQSLLHLLTFKVEIEESQGRIEVGQEGRLNILAHNKGLITVPHVMTHVIKSGDRRVTSVSPRTSDRISYGFTPKVRGTVDVGTIEVKISDALNIFTINKVLEPSRVRVYPKITEERERDLLYDTLGEGEYFRTFSKENAYLIREHRKYRPGDSLRKINWKVSAKFNDLIVKQGESTEERDILIILNMHEAIMAMDEEGIYENTLVTDALSLSQGFLDKDMPHGFILNDPTVKYYFIDNRDKFSSLEDTLIDTKATFRKTLMDFCEDESETLLERGTLIFFTHLNSEDLEAMEKLKNIHNEVIVMAPNIDDPSIDRGNSQMQFIKLKGAGYELDKE